MDLQCFPYELLDVQLSRISAKLIWIINIYLNMKMAQNPGIYLSQCIISLCVRMAQIMSYINKNILMIWIKGSPQSSNCLKIPSFTQPTLILPYLQHGRQQSLRSIFHQEGREGLHSGTIKFAIQPFFSANFSLSLSSTWSQNSLQAVMVINYDHLTLVLATVWPEQRLRLGKLGIRSKRSGLCLG